MIKTVRQLAILATTLLAAPALAQPGTEDPQVITASEAPPVNAGTVVIVTPQQPVVAPLTGPGQMAAVAPTAPQNENWNNVSHINGQLVKVGEHGDYLYDNGKTTSIAVNPIGWMLGFYGISISHAVHANVAIRGDLNWFDFDDHSGHELGVSLPIYFRRVFQGPFLEAGLVARNLGTRCYDCSDSGNDSIGPEVLFGWHWTFDSGFNVAMAFGAMRNMNDHAMSSSKAEPAGYFRVGYAF